MTPILVTWRDASTESHMNWEDRNVKPIADTLVYTVGFERPESEGTANLELCMSYHEDQLAGRWTIPRVCIISVQTLR